MAETVSYPELAIRFTARAEKAEPDVGIMSDYYTDVEAEEAWFVVSLGLGKGSKRVLFPLTAEQKDILVNTFGEEAAQYMDDGH